jgi:alkaline phosphatase/alkaline phosphatase D
MPNLNSLTFTTLIALAGCSGPKAGQGMMVGGVTSTSALAQVRLTKTDKLVRANVEGPSGARWDVPGMAGVVKFSLLKVGTNEGLQTQLVEAKETNDFIARAVFKNLKAGGRYEIRTRIGACKDHLRPGPVASFRSLPGKALAESVRFVVVTGMNYAKFHGDDRVDRAIHLKRQQKGLEPYTGLDKHLGYPALASILKLEPDFFVGTGDNVYYDTPKDSRAETVPELRQKWHEQFVQPRYHDLFAKVPTYWEIDDHDYRIDDGDNSGDHDPSPEVAQKLMYEQLPYAPMGDTTTKTYRTHRVSKDLQIWFVENRIYRSDNIMTDGPGKSIWGAEQRAWLQRTLATSDATFKLMISPNPMIGPDNARKFDNHTNFGGFRHERDEFFGWLKQSGLAAKGFYLMCGDRHWQYHSIHPLGIEEFSCGALVDANSRLGHNPGDPTSTDPKGLINQVYAQKEKSAGFMHIQVDPAKAAVPAKLTVTWHDEHGKVLHATSKQGITP